jgi:hypothetical protein
MVRAYFFFGVGVLPWALTTLGRSIFLEPAGRVAWSKGRMGLSSRTLSRMAYT